MICAIANVRAGTDLEIPKISKVGPATLLIAWPRTMDSQSTRDYLPLLRTAIEANAGRTDLIFDLLRLEIFTHGVLHEHAIFSKQLHDKIGAIGVVTTNLKQRFAVATINTMQRRPVKSFESVDQATSWLTQFRQNSQQAAV